MNYEGACNKTENKIDISNSKLRKITTFAVCLSPVLCIYRVLGVFMLGEVVLIMLLFANLLASFNVKIHISCKQGLIFSFAVGIFLISCLGYLVNGINVTVLPRLIRLLFCLFVAAVLGGRFFDYKSAQKYIIFIALAATVIIIFQMIYHDTTGKYVYFLAKEYIYSPVYNSSYFENVETLSTYRPMSIFLEPSHYCQYMLFALTIVLFRFKFSVKDILIAAFFSAGIFVSTSSTGVILCLALWGLYLFAIVKDSITKGNFNPKVFLVIALIIVVAIAVLLQFGDRFLFAIKRIYDPDSFSTTAAWDGRLGTFSIFFETERLADFLFGRGYGVINEGEWYASIPYYFSGTGILGIVLLLVFFVLLYLNSNRIQKKLLIVFFALCLATEVLTNYWLIFILPLIITAIEDKEKETKEKMVDEP